MDRYFLRRKNVRFITAPAEGVDMGMFDKEQNVGRRLALLALDELLLKLNGSEIIHSAEISIQQHSQIDS